VATSPRYVNFIPVPSSAGPRREAPARASVISSIALIGLALAAAPAALAQAASAATASNEASSQADQVRGYNAELLRLQASARRAGAGSAAPTSARSRAAAVLTARATVLRELIVADPTRAERLALPASVLEQIAATFPDGATALEQRGRWEGELEITIEDLAPMTAARTIVRLHTARGEALRVGFVGGEPPGLSSGRRLRMEGVRAGSTLAVSEIEVLDSALDGTAGGGDAYATATYPAQCTVTGPQSVLSVLVNLPGYRLPVVTTPDFVRGALLGNAYAGTSQSTPDWSVDDFWQQASDGRTYIDTTNSTVIGPIELTKNFNTDANNATSCDNYGLLDAVIRAIDGQVDFKRYSRLLIVMPPNGACGWAGVANVGCRSLSSPGDGSFTASVAWQRADTMQSRGSAVQLSTHELGHNLTLRHASSRDFGSEPVGALGTTGTLTEYGDVHSTMGSWNFGFYASSHAANQLGWLGQGSGYQVAESSGSYTVSNYEARGGAVRALKVRRGTGNDAWLWIESRQSTGIYNSRLNSQLFTGALIHYQDPTTGGYSHLLDYTGGTTSFADAALPAGSTWTDPYSNVSITVTSVTAGGMTVAVNYGGLTCTPGTPAISASPTGVAAAYGASALFNVTVQNTSSAGCAPETMNLATTLPMGWSGSFGNASPTISAGQQLQTTLSVAIPAPYALGTYDVTASARSTSSGRSGADTRAVTVVEPTNRLTLSLSGSGSVAFSSPVRACTSSCTVDYPGSSTVVTLQATAGSRAAFTGWSGACSGTTSTCTVTMDAAQSVGATFRRVSGRK
jgi:M6 family metalloprotease-like protein